MQEITDPLTQTLTLRVRKWRASPLSSQHHRRCFTRQTTGELATEWPTLSHLVLLLMGDKLRIPWEICFTFHHPLSRRSSYALHSCWSCLASTGLKSSDRKCSNFIWVGTYQNRSVVMLVKSLPDLSQVQGSAKWWSPGCVNAAEVVSNSGN